MTLTCKRCAIDFQAYPSRLRRGGRTYCSRRCAYDDRIGRPSYVRDGDHRKRMSDLVKRRDLHSQSERLLEINRSRRGKTFEDIYGDRAADIRASYSKVGEANPNWRGGKTRNRYPYVFYTLRQSVMERDGRVCKNCDMTDDEARSLDRLHRGLTVHHIDYNKNNNSLSNLVTLCKWCNSRANSEREIWQNKYSRLLLGV